VTPKIELHVHLEGTVRPATLLEIAQRNDFALPASTEDGLRALYHFGGLADFVRVWRLTTGCIRTGADARQILLEYAADAAAHGAVYVEAIFVASGAVRDGRGAELFSGYCDALGEAYDRFGVTVRLTPDLFRGLDVPTAEAMARMAVSYRDRGVVGLGLGGDEGVAPVSAYAPAFAIARDGGLGLVPHAGESSGPEAVREVLAYAPERIRHGIGAARDPLLVAELAQGGVVLDVCPTSNVRLGAVPSLAAHPLPALAAAGVRCTVNTDDPGIFETDLATEYEVAASLGHPASAAYAAGLAGALCDEATRGRLATLGPGAHPHGE
jgi:aminodeoxyfutalosine deaminase